ncbi:MAG: hypothetical protein AB1627_06460 [Chloroflexota bacterium]
MTVLVAAWHPVGETTTSFAAHLHGRDLTVVRVAERGWRWRVVAPHGGLLAEGEATSGLEAERAAEDEATAVHPPTSELLDRLLT